MPLLLGAAPTIRFSKKVIAQSEHFCEAAGPAPPGRMSNERPLKSEDPYYQRFLGLVPDAPSGWTADPVELVAFATDTIGCGASARRSYSTGERKADLEIMFSPLVALQLAHPENLRQTGHVFLFKHRPGAIIKDGVMEVFAGSIIVLVRGTASEAEKRAVLELIDLDAVEKF